jgi:hypothetical protein
VSDFEIQSHHLPCSLADTYWNCLSSCLSRAAGPTPGLEMILEDMDWKVGLASKYDMDLSAKEEKLFLEFSLTLAFDYGTYLLDIMTIIITHNVCERGMHGALSAQVLGEGFALRGQELIQLLPQFVKYPPPVPRRFSDIYSSLLRDQAPLRCLPRSGIYSFLPRSSRLWWQAVDPVILCHSLVATHCIMWILPRLQISSYLHTGSVRSWFNLRQYQVLANQ